MDNISWNAFWRIGAFRITVVVSILFFVLITIAMLLYPGGTLTNPHSHGYSFFLNFLSDLGRFSTPSGQSNVASMVLTGYTILLVSVLLFGPTAGTPAWEMIQATGQKVIVSTSMLTALIQALNVLPLLLQNAVPQPTLVGRSGLINDEVSRALWQKKRGGIA